jgi:hypothetical protein
MSATDNLDPEPGFTLPPAGLLTRRQAADYIRDVLGRPMSFSTAQKLAALGEFAEPALWWGRRPLYRREELQAWVEKRGRSHPPPAPRPTQPAPSSSRRRGRPSKVRPAGEADGAQKASVEAATR